MIKKFNSISQNLTRVIDKVGKQFKRQTRKQKEVTDPTENKKVLMFGWELPPFNSGGLGVACYEMAKSISQKKTEVTFVLPKREELNIPFMKVAFADGNSPEGGKSKNSRNKYSHDEFSIREVDSLISPYLTAEEYEKLKTSLDGTTDRNLLEQLRYRKYGKSLIDEVYRYGHEAAKIARQENFDVIHAHDWLSYPAGIVAKKVSKKPLIAHVHALEYDRSHESSVNEEICKIEKAGLENADKVIAISNYVKNRVMHFYQIPENKIEVVHNGITFDHKKKVEPSKEISLKSLKKNGRKIVLFVGRITYQKGVDHLIEAAQKVIELCPKTTFMIVGSGDMTHRVIEQVANMQLSDKVLFPGFLRGKELEQLYKAADVFVMPSVSEPFGLVALEALTNKVPVILSKQSGAVEVLRHALKVDFWDRDELANQIIAVLNNPSLQHSLAQNGYREVKGCSWDNAADKCIQIYSSLPVVS